MTVAELIEQLQALPPTMEVWRLKYNADWPAPYETLPKPRLIHSVEFADDSPGWFLNPRGKVLETKTVLLIGQED